MATSLQSDLHCLGRSPNGQKFGGIISLDVMDKRPDEWRQIKNEDNSYE
jgi:hypothetical protein